MADTLKTEDQNQSIYFIAGCLIFAVAAYLGWEKLYYGFNFIDEGYHMTESWRLAVGDDFLRDKLTGAAMYYTLINRIIFKMFPDITLLGFRKLQYILTISSLLLLSFSLYKVTGKYWFQPYIFSFFAFSGLDPLGMIPNLYYQTYPHLFITLYVSTLMIGLIESNIIIRRLCLILSGLFLWLISLSLFHLSIVILSPVILFFISIKFRFNFLKMSFKDLLYILLPFIACWSLFIIIFNKPYINNLIYSIAVILSSKTHSAKSLLKINLPLMSILVVSFIEIVTIIFCMNKLRNFKYITGLMIISIISLIVIITSLGGLIPPYYNNLFNYQIWFAAFLISCSIMMLIVIGKTFIKKSPLNQGEEIGAFLLIPFTVIAVTLTFLSGLGALSVLHCSIPVVAAIACIIIFSDKLNLKTRLAKIATFIILFFPYYSTTSYADWQFTFFDVAPVDATVIIDSGFGKGIKTNQAYKKLYEWIQDTSEKYTAENEFIISYVTSPMVHMIAKRRPALNDTFVDLYEFSTDYYEKSVQLMRDNKREPKLAFIFEGMPALYPISIEERRYAWFSNQFNFNAQTQDPISRYIINNMVFLDDFKIGTNLAVKCYIRPIK